MLWTTPRLAWSILAASSIAVAILTVYLTDWLDLDPCYLCVFQRLLLLIIGTAALATALAFGIRSISRVTQTLFIATASFGIATAAYQSWLQAQPAGTVTCSGGQPGMIEILVEWLGTRWPDMFLATGFCEEAGLTVLGLSLANWALVCFAFFACLGIWLAWRSRFD